MMIAEGSEDIQSMKVSDIKKELESYGISTKTFLEKKEIIETLRKAREEGLQPVSSFESKTKSCSRGGATGDDVKDDPGITSEVISRGLLGELMRARGEAPAELSDGQIVEEISTHLHRSRIKNLHLRRCRVGPSSLPDAGVGIFATRDLAAGELITLYPGDALRVTPPPSHSNEEITVLVYHGTHIPPDEMEQIGLARRTTTAELDDTVNSHLFLVRGIEATRYELSLSRKYESGKQYKIVGDHRRCHDPAYLGHLVNDAARITAVPEDTKETIRVKRDFYNRQSMAGANAKFEQKTCHVEVVATKPISAGQEIFVSYSERYWLPILDGEWLGYEHTRM
jgi:SET domain